MNTGAIRQFITAALRRPELLVPNESRSSISDICFKTLSSRGFKAIIFDKDNTLTSPHGSKFFNTSIELAAKSCVSYFPNTTLIYSNSAGSRDDSPPDFPLASSVSSSLHNIPVLCHGGKKPDYDSNDDLKSILKCEYHEMVMIGDRYSTDVLFGNQKGMYTIRTNQLVPEKYWILRFIQNAEAKFCQNLEKKLEKNRK